MAHMDNETRLIGLSVGRGPSEAFASRCNGRRDVNN